MASESTPQDRLEALLDEVVGSGPVRVLLDEAIIRVVNSVEAAAQELDVAAREFETAAREQSSHSSAPTQAMGSRI